MSYPLLAAALLGFAVLVRVVASLVARRRGDRIRMLPTVGTASVLVALTLVFDNLMIALGLFAYADAQLLGWRIGFVPIEDLSYPLAVAIALPGVWHLVPPRRVRAHGADERNARVDA